MSNVTGMAVSSGNQVNNSFFSRLTDWFTNAGNAAQTIGQGAGQIAGTVGNVIRSVRNPVPVGSGAPDLIGQPTYSGGTNTTGSLREQPKDYTLWIVGGVAVIAAVVLLRK